MPKRSRMFWLRDAAILVAVLAFAGMLISMWLNHFAGPHRPSSLSYCLNNQSQLDKAILTSTVRKEAFPRFQDEFQQLAVPWTVQILPELDRLDLYDELERTGSVSPVWMEILICPANPPYRASEAPLSYVINAGCAQDAGDVRANGIALDGLVSDGSVTLSYVAQNDGVSYTLMLGENLQATRWDKPSRAGTTFLWQQTTSPRDDNYINGGNLYDDVTLDTARPSSNHPGRAVFTFCDGHTEIISEEIEYKVYMQLMTPYGAKSDMPDEWKDFILIDDDIRKW